MGRELKNGTRVRVEVIGNADMVIVVGDTRVDCSVEDINKVKDLFRLISNMADSKGLHPLFICELLGHIDQVSSLGNFRVDYNFDETRYVKG